MTIPAKIVSAVAASLAFGSAFADDVAHDDVEAVVTNSNFNVNTTTACWTNRTSGGAVHAWTNAVESANYAVFPSGIPKTKCSLYFTQHVYGIVNESANAVVYTLCDVKVGAGGLKLTKAGGCLSFGYYDTAKKILNLTADQTWNGANETGTSVISVGYEDNFHKPYTRSSMAAGADVRNLAVQGRLVALFYGEENGLGNVAVRVAAPAEVDMLDVTVTGSDAGSQPVRTLGKLNAKSLTLTGDGVRSRFGALAPAKDKFMDKAARTTTPLIDAATLAPTVTLDDGADLMVTNATFALDRLYVTGLGTSSIFGSTLTFTNATTTFDVAAGSTLELAAIPVCSAPDGKLSVVGGGTLSLAVADALAPIDVADGSTLKLTNPEPTFVPISGAGKIVVALDDGEKTFIDDLTDFIGSIEVTGGTLYLQSAPAGGVTTSGTGAVSYDLAAGKYVSDAAIENAVLEVGPGETLYVAGDGLKASSTVWMKGGTMRVLRDSTVYAAVTQNVSSVYKTDLLTTRVTFAGPFRVAGTPATTAAEKSALYDLNATTIYGGDVRFTGGLYVSYMTDTFWVQSGTVEFSRTDCSFCGYGGMNRDSVATRWTIDGVEFNCDWSNTKLEPNTIQSSVIFYFRPGANSELVLTNGAALNFKQSRCLEWGYNGGKSGTFTNKITIADGTVTMPSYGSTSISTRPSNSGWPMLEFRKGHWQTMRQFDRPVEIDWHGGTIRPKFDGNRLLGGRTCNLFNNTAGVDCPVRILGPDCVLDLSANKAASVVTNCPANAYSVWTGAAGGKLAVKGPGKLVLNNFKPNGMALELQDKANLVVSEWSADATLGELAICATNCAAAIETAAAAPAVGTLRVGAGGRWDNDLIASVLAGFGNATFTNAALSDGAEWPLVPNAVSIAVAGTLTFSGEIKYRVDGTDGRFAAATAAGGIVVDGATWTKLGGTKHAFRVDGKTLYANPGGTALIVR